MEGRFYITPEDYLTAAKNGLTRKDVYRRVYELNWIVERAISEPKLIMSPRTEYTKDERAMMIKNDITPTLVTKRINSGWERKVAVSTPKGVGRKNKCNKKKSKYADEVFEAIKNNGIKLDTFYWRVRNGWSVERATTTPAKIL